MAVVVVVCPEKEWNRWAEDGFEAVKRLMPMKLFPAHKSVDGCSKLQKAGNACTACFLYKTFSAPGKEEYSDTLRKFLKEKAPSIPVIAFGSNKSSAGKEGDNFHVWMEVDEAVNPREVATLLQKVQAGEIVATYGGSSKRRASMEGRKSIDGGARPPSMDMGSARRSLDSGSRPLGRTSAGMAATYAGMDGPNNPARRMSIGDGRGSPVGGMAPDMGMGMYGGGGLSPRAMAMPGMGAAFAGPALASQRNSLDSRMAPMAAAGVMSPMAGAMGAGLTPGFAPMGGLMGGGLPASPIPTATPAAFGSLASAGSFTAAPAVAVTPLKTMAALPLSPSGLESMAAGVIPAAAAPGGNTADLVKALAEEVIRLRKAVEEKRAREAAATATAAQ